MTSVVKKEANIETVYWHDPAGETSATHELNWDLERNNVVRWMESNGVEVPAGNLKDLGFIQDNILEIGDMIVGLVGGTEVCISELSPVNTDTNREPYFCPCCGSEDLNASPMDSDDNCAWRDVGCPTCDFSWTEKFTFSSWETTDEDMNKAISRAEQSNTEQPKLKEGMIVSLFSAG